MTTETVMNAQTGAWVQVDDSPFGYGGFTSTDFSVACSHYAEAFERSRLDAGTEAHHRDLMEHIRIMDTRMSMLGFAHAKVAWDQHQGATSATVRKEFELVLVRSAALALAIADTYGIDDVWDGVYSTEERHRLLDRACWLAWRVQRGFRSGRKVQGLTEAQRTRLSMDVLLTENAVEALSSMADSWAAVWLVTLYVDMLDFFAYMD